MRRLFYIIGFLTICWLFAFSQQNVSYNEGADAVFENALSRFEEGKYVEARSLFNKCIFEYESHHRTTASYIMLAKSEYNLKKYKDALLTISELLEYYPNSNYIREAYYVSGLAHYKMNKVDTALFYLFKSYDGADQEEDNERIVRPIKYIYSKNKTGSLPFANSFNSEKARQLLADLKSGKVSINSPQNVEEDSDEANDENEAGSDIKKSLVEKENLTEYSIGVFTVPNNLKNKKGHEELEDDYSKALEYAVEEFNLNSSVRLKLKFIESKQDTQSFVKEIQALSDDKNLLAIVGPIYSEQFGIAASIASKKGIPIISPTATGNSLASAGEYVFQANPDFITRAKAMAIYGIKRGKYKNIAIFAPKNVYGKMMSESFSREAIKRGGNIIGTDFYESDSKKMQKAMLNLVNSVYSKGGEIYLSLLGEQGADNIQKLLKGGVSKKLLDSLKTYYKEVNIFTVLGKDAKSKSERLKIKTFSKTTYEVDQPIYSIDAIYIPINSKNDIKNISASLQSYQIHAKILGTGDYNHILELNANQKTMDELVFDSDSYFDITNKNSIAFSKIFSEKTGRKMSQYSLFAYDALSFVIQAVKKGNVSRQQIKNYLSSADVYQGLHSKISLKSNRINSYLNILEYKNKKISKIDEINVSKE